MNDDAYDLKYMADHSDGLLLMNYDQHQMESEPGPIAAQDWFLDNLKAVLKIVPKEKVICALGSYGYDWTMSLPPAGARPSRRFVPKVLAAEELSTQEAWQAAEDAEAQIDWTPTPSMVTSPTTTTTRMSATRCGSDAVTILNQMRAARALGIETFALWRLGSEDNSLWKIWDRPIHSNPVLDLAHVEPGFDVDTEGEGDILRSRANHSPAAAPSPWTTTIRCPASAPSPPKP